MADLAAPAFEAALQPSDEPSTCSSSSTLLQDIVAAACELSAGGKLSISPAGLASRRAPQPRRLLAGLMQTPAHHLQPLLLAPAALAGCYDDTGDTDDDADDEAEECDSSGACAPWPAAPWAAAGLSVRPAASSSSSSSCAARARGPPRRRTSRCLCSALAAAAAATPASQQVAVAARDTCSSCSSSNSAAGGPLQQWLSHMEAQLQVPPAQIQRKRALAPAHAATNADAAGATSLPASTNKRRGVAALLQHWPAAPARMAPDSVTPGSCGSTSHAEPRLPGPAWALVGLHGRGGSTH